MLERPTCRRPGAVARDFARNLSYMRDILDADTAMARTLTTTEYHDAPARDDAAIGGRFA